MPSRLKLIISYDGALFAGWQSQASRNTIQDCLEKAFYQICSRPVRVHGAGRTDAGVHALAQCAHVDLPKPRYDPDRWVAALNGLLPPAIRIMRCRFVSEAFHARFSAKGKTYRYRVWNAPVLPPLQSGRAWHVINVLDFERMARAAEEFCGEHDFAAFRRTGEHLKQTPFVLFVQSACGELVPPFPWNSMATGSFTRWCE